MPWSVSWPLLAEGSTDAPGTSRSPVDPPAFGLVRPVVVAEPADWPDPAFWCAAALLPCVPLELFAWLFAANTEPEKASTRPPATEIASRRGVLGMDLCHLATG